ncbi:MAG: P-type conjugative transfer protein TrbL [Bdellovibrionales bacterium]
MSDLSIIDQFMTTFSRYIDSGFGLLSGDVAFLSTTLIGIDVTLAGLFWAFEGENVIFPRLIRKVLYVGAFAFILNNFKSLADIVYQSFANLGIKASGSSFSAADLLRPGVIAATGYQSAHPLLDQVSHLVGFPEIFSNALTVFVLLIAWLLVIFAFFILSIQLFISVLEFKLTTLAGFVLVPFALWNKTAFLAEKVLGNVISSGIKMMVLAVIVGIGSTLFATFTTGLDGQDTNLAAAMSQVLGALALLGLGIFGPGIAAGLVSGAPQLGAGAALGTTGAAVGAVALTGAAAYGATRAAGAGGLAAVRAGTSMTAAASTSYQLGQATSGETGIAGVAAGVGGVARAARGGVAQAANNLKNRVVSSFSESASAGRNAAWTATGGAPTSSMSQSASSAGTSAGSAPDWARRMRTQQATRASTHAVSQAIKDGDRPVQGDTPSLHQKE